MGTGRPFEQLVGDHGPAVLRLCRSMLAAADAEDAWSEAFLAALRAYPDLPADANTEAWLVTIARRKCLDLLRTQARRAVPVDRLPEVASDLGVWSERDDDLWARLAALPPKQRQAVGYHHVAGMPYAEVARLLGGTPEAARRAAADGIARLRRTHSTQEGPR